MAGTAVVTGSSTGIGRATAEALHEAGWSVVATMRDPAAGAGLPCRVEALDVTSDESVATLFDAVGDVDLLVNNAGVGSPSSVEFGTIDELRSVMDTNLFGVARCTKAVLPSMRERGAGCVVNVSSVAGRVALAHQAPYHASKFALEGWSECLALEVAPFGIRVAIVEPGVVDTPIWTKPYEGGRSPYGFQSKRTTALMFANARHGTTAADVAAVILEAATTSTPRLRWPVGPDAELLIAGAAAVPDEARVAASAVPKGDDDAHWAAMAELFDPSVLP